MVDKDKISKSGFGKALGLSPGRITQLIKLGLPTCENGRWIPLARAREWYEDRIHGSGRKRGPDPTKTRPIAEGVSSESKASSASRLLAAQADRAESLAIIAGLEARRRKNELLEAGDVEQTWSKMILAVRNRFLDLPGKMAPRVIRLSDVLEIQEAIRAEVHSILTGLSQDPFGEDAK